MTPARVIPRMRQSWRCTVSGTSLMFTMETRAYDIRSTLAEWLNQAAELEHGLCLQYLYAGFALKSQISEGGVTMIDLEYVRDWKRALYRVAREEMLHLGLVCNVLAAIGYPAKFNRPNFPLSAEFYPMGVPASLEPSSLEAGEA